MSRRGEKRTLAVGGYKKNQKRILGQKGVILDWMARSKSFAFGCAKAGISYTQGRHWRRDDEIFDLACAEANEVGTQVLEDIADGRAKRRSDILLMFLLKGRDSKYRDSTKIIVNNQPPAVTRRDF